MQRPFFGSVLGYSSAVLTIAALAFYCVARIAFSLYYGHYGVSPESVGVTFQGLLIQEASALNVALLVVVAAIFLRAGWLVNNAELDANQIRQMIDTAQAERETQIRSIASNAATDVSAQRRQLLRLESQLKELAAEQAHAVQSGHRITRQGGRWFAAGLADFRPLGCWNHHRGRCHVRRATGRPVVRSSADRCAHRDGTEHRRRTCRYPWNEGRA